MLLREVMAVAQFMGNIGLNALYGEMPGTCYIDGGTYSCHYKFVLYPAVKAQRGSRSIALLIL
jgi:hypothetical protein